MIKEKRKAEIVKYYLKIKEEPKTVKRTADKFDISEKSVYNILSEYEIQKPSEIEEDDYSEVFCAEYPIYDSEHNIYVARLNHTGRTREKRSRDKKLKDVDVEDEGALLVKRMDQMVKIAEGYKKLISIFREIYEVEQKPITDKINTMLSGLVESRLAELNREPGQDIENVPTPEPSMNSKLLEIMMNPLIPNQSKSFLFLKEALNLYQKIPPKEREDLDKNVESTFKKLQALQRGEQNKDFESALEPKKPKIESEMEKSEIEKFDKNVKQKNKISKKNQKNSPEKKVKESD